MGGGGLATPPAGGKGAARGGRRGRPGGPPPPTAPGGGGAGGFGGPALFLTYVLTLRKYKGNPARGARRKITILDPGDLPEIDIPK